MQKKHLAKSNTHSWFKKKKTLSKLGTEGNVLNLIKNSNKTHLASYLMVRNLKLFCEDQVQGKDVPPISLLFNIIL